MWRCKIYSMLNFCFVRFRKKKLTLNVSSWAFLTCTKCTWWRVQSYFSLHKTVYMCLHCLHLPLSLILTVIAFSLSMMHSHSKCMILKKGKVHLYNVHFVFVQIIFFLLNGIFKFYEGALVRKMNFILQAYFTPSISCFCRRVEKCK